jgi:hypothetical protein
MFTHVLIEVSNVVASILMVKLLSYYDCPVNYALTLYRNKRPLRAITPRGVRLMILTRFPSSQ